MSASKELKKEGASSDLLSSIYKAFPKFSERLFVDFAGGLESATNAADVAKGAISGLWTVISAHPILATVAAVTGLAMAFDALYVSGDEANEKMNNSMQSYDDEKSKLESINQELENTKSTMSSLMAKDGLTFVEKGQLEDLRAATEELRAQQNIQEAKTEASAKKLAKDSYEAYKKNFGGYGDVSDQSVIDAKNAAEMYASEDDSYYTSNEKDLAQMIAGLQLYRQKSEEAFTNGDQKGKEYYDNLASYAESSLMSQIGDLQDYQSNLESIPYGQLTTNERKALDSIKDTIEYAWKQVDENEWNQMQFDKIFDDQAMYNAKESLVDIAKASNNVGVSVDDVKNKYPALASEVEKAGFSIEDLVDTVNSEAGIKNFDEIRQQLKDIEDIVVDGDYSKKIKDDWDSFVDGLSDDQIDIMYSIKESNNTDGWSIDEWKQQIEDTANLQAETASNTQKTFSSIMGNTEDGSLSKSIDTFQESTSTINTALQTLQEGGQLSASDISDLIQQFPQLANETDNLGTALANLNADNLSSMLSTIDEQMKTVTSDSDKKAFENLKNQLIDSVDLSGVDKSKVTDGLRNLFESNANDAVTRSFAKDQIAKINDAFSDELKTAEGKEILYKLSLKPEAVNWDMSEWQSQFDEELARTSKNTLEKYVTQATNDLSALQTATSEASSTTGLTKSSIDSISQMFSGIPNFDADALFRNTADGVKLNTKALSSLLSVQHDIKATEFDKDIQKQTEAIKKQNDAVQEAKGTADFDTQQTKLKDMLASLADMQQAQSQYHALYKQQQELFSDYGQWQQAQSTANAGDKYNNMVSGLETAKKAFDAGEVGTDDFKTFAKMISPSGSTDAANFAENYGKAARYLTEDESGLLNFFQDLSTKTDAAGEKMAKFNEETQSWELNVHDLGEIAQTLGTGTPLVEALFGRAEDYGATSTVISDMQDGILKSTEATKNWAEAKARLDRMNEENAQAQQDGKDPIYNTTAIQAAEDEVAKYQKQIDGLQESMDYYEEHNLGSEAQQKKIKTAADEISNIQQKMQEAEKTNNQSLANAYRNLAKEKAAAAGITVDDDLNVTGNGKTAQEQLQEKSSSGSSSLSGTDFNYDKASMTLDEIDSKINELQGKRATIDVDVEGEETVNALDTEISALEAQKIQVQIQTAVENGNSLQELLTLSDQELMTTVGCDASQVDAVRAEIQEMSGESVDLTVAMDSTQFVALINAITGETVEVPVEANTDGAVQETTSAIEGSNPKVTPEVDTSNVESQTQSAVQSAAQGATVDIPSVDVKGKITSVEPYSGEVDINAKANITGVVGGDSLNVVVNARAHVTGSDGQTSEGTINYKKGNVEKADGTTSEGIINYKKGDVEKADGTVSTGTINYDLGDVATPTGMVATGVINYTLGSVAKPGKAAGTFGQTRAYAQGSLTDLSAYAGGRVSLPKDEKALVNEIGTESIVRDGQWSLIPGGAHLENLKKGDIIFSASQTEDLLKRGATPGHARAYAQGSLSDLSPLSNAYSVGGLSLKFGGGLSNKTSVSSGSSGSSDTPATKQHTNAVKDDTSATEDNTKATKDSTEAFDWVKTKLDKFAKSVERISNQITDYISSAFKTVLLKRQVKAVEKQLKANEQGYTAYMNKANSVDISDDYKNKVINGTFSIEEIDTSSDSGKQLAKDIKQFQEFYNSAQDCKDTVQELNNKLLELYETIVNMPTEKAEKKIDRLKTKLESLNAVSDTVSLGGSAIAAMQNQIKVDIPGFGNAQKKLDKAETARNATKKTRAKASKALKSATADAESTGNTLIKESEKQTKSIGKKLKNAAKSSTDKATYNAIAQAVREGKPVNLKGLKGSALKYAKSYNSSLKQGNTIASKVKAGKTVKTSGMSGVLKSAAVAYNTDAKEKASAQKVYYTAKKADEKALNDLTKAQKNKEKLYAGSTKEQQILATTKGKKSYVYQNMLLTQETKNLKEQNKQRQKALKETRDSYMKAKSNYDTADADKTKSQNKLLNNKTVMSKLSDSQKKALKAGKTVSTKGITDPKVLKWIQDYNEKVKKSADLSKKLRIEQEALDKATSEAAQSQAEYAQSIVENAKKKLENIANYYDSFTSQWENRNSMYEAYMDRMQTQGYNLSTKFYEAEIGQQQKIVDNLSQKYIAMKRNFAQAVQDGKIVEGTEEYYEMQNEIDQVAISLKEAQNKVVEFQAAIRDLKWEQFDQLQEAIGRITSESDFLIDLMSHKDMYDKDGNMTEQGLATMGLHGVNYNTYMAQADKYKEEMLKISEELANDPNNQKLIDRKNELIDAQQQAILSAEDEKDSIKDLIQDGIDKQLDALDDLIDKYLDCLDSEKSLYEYRKKIGEQSEKIASLQKQLSSLQGDNSEEAKAKLQKLKEDLKSAQDDLEESQYDKYISDQEKLIDDFRDSMKKALDDRMDNVDALLSDAIASINSNSSNISQTLQTESKNVGYTLSGEMQTIWTSQSQALSMYDGKFDTRFTGVTTAIGNVYERQKSMIDAIDKMAEKLVAKADQMLQQPTQTNTDDNKTDTGKTDDNKTNTNTDDGKDHHLDGALLWGEGEYDKLHKNDNNKTGNNKAEVGDKVTFSSGRYYEASDGTGASGNMYLGKKVKITRINKGSKYPYAIDATDGTELGWVKLNQLKGYASGIMRVPNDQLAWTQEQGEEAIVRNDGSILTPLTRDVSVLNADMTKNLWDFMGNPGSFLSDYSDGEKFGVKNVDNSSSVDVGGVTIQCNMPNVQNANDLLHELTTNKDIEKAICAMTIGRAMGGSSLAKYKYKK